MRRRIISTSRPRTPMNALRLIVYSLMTPAAIRGRERVPPQSPARIYDPFSLATRPLPTDLRIYPHPRELAPMRVRQILGLHG